MSEGPLVSIIVNNYNYARFLGAAIDSALDQTYAATEVLVVDDGSTDESRQILDDFRGRIIPVLKTNGGQGSAFNAGFRACHGEIICFLDADDQLCPTAAEAAVRLFREANTVNVHWPLHIIDENGRRTGEIVPRGSLPAEGVYERIVREGPLYDWHLTPPTSGNAWARSFLQKVFPMPEAPYRLGADVYLITLAPLYGRRRRSQEPLGSYRAHGGNNYWNRRLDDERLREYLRRFDTACTILCQHLHDQGINANSELWKQTNFNYLWPQRLLQAKQDLSAIVPVGESYLLINGDEWGVGEHVLGRHAIPFLEREGVYAGPPADDEQAIRELERLRQIGASVLAIWWTEFWWLDHYPAFARHLRKHFDCILDAEHLIAFDLRRRMPANIKRPVPARLAEPA